MTRPLPSHEGVGPRLNSTVHVLTDSGSYEVYGPDDEVPEAHARKIGAHAWEGGVHPYDDDADGQPDREAGVEPTRNGKGSSRDAWVSFAHETGHGELVGDKTRDEIVQALVDAGVVTA